MNRLRTNYKSPQKQARPKLAADIQAILTVLGQRTRTTGEGKDKQLRKGEENSLNLRKVDLRGAALVEAHLEKAHLQGAHLEGASTGEYSWMVDLAGGHPPEGSGPPKRPPGGGEPPMGEPGGGRSDQGEPGEREPNGGQVSNG
jgi:Pentapeptide repeats (8 copies)